jgi:hypothetical protein
MTTIVLATATLAALAISLASVEAATARRHAPGVRVLRASPPIYSPNGRYLGSDPDSFIRGQLRRDIPLGSQGE